MASQLVSIKFEERKLKLRPNIISERNLSMIFKLDMNRGIFLTSEGEGEIILADNAGNFTIEDPTKCYLVNGELDENSPRRLNESPAQRNRSIGLPSSYQRTATNPPPTATRPSFVSAASRPKVKTQWKKSFMVVDVSPNGAVTEKFQIHLVLQEETARVDQLERILKDQLGYDVTLLDSKYLPIMAGEMTQGSQFWKSSRKVMVARASESGYLSQSRRAKRAKTDVLDKIREIVESRDAPQTTQQPREESTSVKEEAVKKITNIFKCSICLNTTQLPAAVCSDCYSIIGCIPCIEQWHESTSSGKCPLCRTCKSYQTFPVVRGIAELLGQAVPAPETRNDEVQSFAQQSDEEEDDSDLLSSVFE